MNHLALSHDQPLLYHLKIDSGMGRLGTRAAAEILRTIEETPHAELEGLMTHFASAVIIPTCKLPSNSPISTPSRASATGRRERRAAAYFEHQRHRLRTHRRLAHMVRAGHALYGYVSPARGDAPPQLLDVKPVLTWKAKLLAVKDIPEGARVGYGGSFQATHPMRIGILGAGYADGIFHRLSNRGKVIADGKFTAILGSISMDLTTIDLSHATALGPATK